MDLLCYETLDDLNAGWERTDVMCLSVTNVCVHPVATRSRSVAARRKVVQFQDEVEEAGRRLPPLPHPVQLDEEFPCVVDLSSLSVNPSYDDLVVREGECEYDMWVSGRSSSPAVSMRGASTIQQQNRSGKYQFGSELQTDRALFQSKMTKIATVRKRRHVLERNEFKYMHSSAAWRVAFAT